MKEFFLNEKRVDALVFIFRRAQSKDYTYAREVSVEIDSTNSHTINLIQDLKENDLVESQKEGRKKYLRPTEKGSRIAELFDDLLGELDPEGDVDPLEETDLEVNL